MTYRVESSRAEVAADEVAFLAAHCTPVEAQARKKKPQIAVHRQGTKRGILAMTWWRK